MSDRADETPILLPFPKEDERWEAFQVPWLRHIATRLATSTPGLWIRMGNLESSLLSSDLEPISLRQPIYIAGLARSGSTVLLETVASFPGVVSHRYRDFPYVFTPFWWNRFLDRSPRKKSQPRPRVHADGLVISPESPEALEEPIWLAFFRQARDFRAKQILDASTNEPRFESFYRNHLRKLLLLRSGERYACKGNYHVARLEYLLKIFPDAKFIVPIRRPHDHVASLIKQHRLFTDGESRHPRALLQMQACGHFEFGLDRRAIHFGDSGAVESIEHLWQHGEEARGWARYWSQVYSYLAHRLQSNATLRQAVLIVRFEDLCSRAEESVGQIAKHCGLSDDGELIKSLSKHLHAPTYYRPKFSAKEVKAIEEETSDVAARFGYRQAAARAA